MKCKECNRMIPKPKMNKSGRCTGCSLKTRYERNKEASQNAETTHSGGLE